MTAPPELLYLLAGDPAELRQRRMDDDGHAGRQAERRQLPDHAPDRAGHGRSGDGVFFHNPTLYPVDTVRHGCVGTVRVRRRDRR